MVPRTFPSSLHPFTGRRQLVALFLGDVTGLQRWVDYIPVNFGSGTSLVEGSYENNGFIAIQEISSGIGLQAFLDYIPVFFDAGSTDTWHVSAVGFIPYGVSGVTSPPSLELSFTRSQTLDPRITFTRSTTATFTGSDGLIQTAAIDAPRFDYNPTTLAPLGLLIEEQRVNLLTYSEQFDNAAWTKTRSSITANTVVAPDGALTGDTFADDTASGTHLIRTATITSAPTTSAVTATIYAKQNDQSNLFILYVTGDSDSSAYGRVASTFNLSTGVVAGSNAVNGATFTSSSITAVGNGWYRCSVTGTVGSTASPTGVRFVAGFATAANASVASTYAGTGQSIYIWGAQLEAGAFATSYIPTVASQVTRSADIAVMTGTNFSTWYNATEGTLFGQADWLGLSNNDYFFAINNGTTSNLIAIGVSGAPATRFIVIDGGVTQASVSGPTPVANVAFKIAGAYQANSFAAATNGTLGTVDTSGTVPSVNQVSLTSSFGSANQFNGHIRQIVYYPRRLANAELQGITA
jgi:hypothetical protein